MSGQLFVFSAPSGTGKSTILVGLRERIHGLGYSISHTSRKPRSIEGDGVDYHFVDEDAFKKMIRSGAFVEWAEVYGNLYGTSYESLKVQMNLGLDVLLDLDAQGAANIKRSFENSILVYIVPPSLESLEKRLRERATEDESVIKKRMERAAQEIRDSVWYDYIIINRELENAISEACALIISERCRTDRRAPEIKRIFSLSFP